MIISVVSILVFVSPHKEIISPYPYIYDTCESISKITNDKISMHML